MRESQWIFININNGNDSVAPKGHCYIQVSLKDREGGTVEEIVENALFSDRNFRDLSGLSIGLTAARKFGIRRIMILTNNAFLETIIKNGPEEDYRDRFGLYPDLKGLIDSFEEVGVNVDNWGEQRKSIFPMRLSSLRAVLMNIKEINHEIMGNLPRYGDL